ncbi:MAG: hypothetical protein ABI467_26880 [Kofleriaceae bacterium]
MRSIVRSRRRTSGCCSTARAATRFRRDSVDRAWELIQPVLQVWEATPGVHFYEDGQSDTASLGGGSVDVHDAPLSDVLSMLEVPLHMRNDGRRD